MIDDTPDNSWNPAQTDAPENKTPLNGSLSVADLAERNPLAAIKLGKQTIRDAGRRLAQIQGLKPGSSSKRTPEMIAELIERLQRGETITSITCDTHMPAVSTLWNWCDADEALDNAIKKAQAQGQRTLADLRLNIAAGGEFSTGDARRDEILIKAINANIAQRNRHEFGEKVSIEHSTAPAPVILPTIVIPPLEDDD